MTLQKVRENLRKQHDVKRTRITTHLGKRVIQATIRHTLSDGSVFSRKCYFDKDGELVRTDP